jgi:hypothetical protein
MIRATAIVLSALAAPAAAQSAFSLPQGCTATVTMQKRSCVVTHLFTCAGDPAGHQRRVDLDDQGMIYLGVIDAETQWIESYSPRSGITTTLIDGATDPASLTTLIDTGTDTFDFMTDGGENGMTRYRGTDTLTGQTVTIDGVDLQETTFEVRAYTPTGTLEYTVAGTEFINPDWRTFVSGRRIVTYPDSTEETDATPVEFAFPGEIGFLSNRAKFDCGVVLSSYEVSK